MPPGAKLPRMGSWPALWALVPATAPLAYTTWARLCGDASVDTIAARLEGGAAAPTFSCYSWNARWVKASTPKAALKRQLVLDRVLAGHVVCAQETYWSEAQGYAWAGLFPASQVAFAHAHTYRPLWHHQGKCGSSRAAPLSNRQPAGTRARMCRRMLR